LAGKTHNVARCPGAWTGCVVGHYVRKAYARVSDMTSVVSLPRFIPYSCASATKPGDLVDVGSGFFAMRGNLPL